MYTGMLGAKYGFGPSADFAVQTSDRRSAQQIRELCTQSSDADLAVLDRLFSARSSSARMVIIQLRKHADTKILLLDRTSYICCSSEQSRQ